MTTVTLFRPVGSAGLALIEASGFTAFPPRLPEQPIFYPVTNEDYATQIARSWNTKFDDKLGFVTRFKVTAEFLDGFERKIVGAQTHEEYWIPAEQLDAFNAAIIEKIEIIGRFTEQDRIAHEESNLTHA